MSKYVKLTLVVTRPNEWGDDLTPDQIRNYFVELLDELMSARKQLDHLATQTIRELTNSKPH